MSRIYTKTGDTGETSLFGGERVRKDDIRIEVNGEIDELTCAIGVVRAMMSDGDAVKKDLETIQEELMVVMGYVASDKGLDDDKRMEINALVAKMEAGIDERASGMGFSFVLPGANELSASLHLVRAKARTVERRLWTLSREYLVDLTIMMFFNRLSDYLFALACDV